MPRQPRKNKKLSERAEPIRKVLQQLIHKKVKTKEQRVALAEYLHQEETSVRNMIYSGEGGLDSWIGALAYCYNLDPKSVGRSVEDFFNYSRKSAPTSKVDKLYAEICDLYEEDSVYALLSMILAAGKLTKKK